MCVLVRNDDENSEAFLPPFEGLLLVSLAIYGIKLQATDGPWFEINSIPKQ